MARFDKYDPKSGGFRAPLNATWLEADVAVLRAVGLNSTGKVVKGAGQSGVKGIVALGKIRNAGHPVDVMTAGEIVDCAGLVAGTTYYADTTTGVVSTTNTGIYVGHTVEADRLIVRMKPSGGAA